MSILSILLQKHKHFNRILNQKNYQLIRVIELYHTLLILKDSLPIKKREPQLVLFSLDHFSSSHFIDGAHRQVIFFC